MLPIAWIFWLVLIIQIMEPIEPAPSPTPAAATLTAAPPVTHAPRATPRGALWANASSAGGEAEEADALRVNCSEKVRRCLPQGLLPFQGACYAALSNATCGAGEWLALDAAAAAAGLLGGACVPRRPCGGRRLRLRASGRCHSEQHVRRVLCPGAALLYAPTGDVVCSRDRQRADAAIKVVAICDHQEAGGASEGEKEEASEDTDSSLIEVLIQFIRGYIADVSDGPPSDCTRDDDGNCSPPVNGA